jgi:hypothetical protein
MPTLRALDSPPFGMRITRIRGSRERHASTRAAVSSVEPSSTTRTSWCGYVCWARPARQSAMVRPPL